MITRRTRTLAAPRENVWAIVADPYHLPRWWPKVERVEGVTDEGWTTVLRAERSRRMLRADYTLTAAEPPRLRAWKQEIEGTPFEGVVSLVALRLELEETGPAETTATLTLDQRMRGMSRLGGPMAKSAARSQLDAALAGLAAIVEP